MKTYALVIRPDEESEQVAKKIRSRLDEAGYAESEHPETVFVIGGDGTFIYAVNLYIERLDSVVFYGIHTGTLGFYTDFRSSEVEEFIQAFLCGHTKEVHYPLLETRTEDEVYYAINEMRIENAARTQQMDIRINNELFETYRGTGVCVSTQLGSTAYNRSLRGAVVQEGLNVIQLCEISGIHHAKYRSLGSPFVLRDDAVIEFVSHSFEGALLGNDSRVQAMDDIKRVKVQISKDKYVRMLRGRDVSYLSRLKSLF